jgi:type I restriction enzyme S subunit
MSQTTTTNTFQKYPAYKDSGVEWLGEVPEHWEIYPGLRFISENKSKNTGMKRNTVLSLSYGKIRVKQEDELTGLVPESFETYQLVNKGDLIFRPTDLQNDTVSLRSAFSEYDGIITNAYLNLKFKDTADSKFFHYFFRAIDNNKIIYGLGSGLRQNISYLDFRRFQFPFPPLSEQSAIAAFLDEKTAKIELAITQKEKMIALLKERKQIIIQNAVTKGLDPNVRMKDSGVEWIGEVPEGWEVKSIKHLKKNIKNSFVDGPFGSNLKSEHFIENGDVYVVESGFITTGEFINKEFKTISLKHFETIKRSECIGGDIIIAKIGANFGMAAELPVLDKRSVVSGNSLKITLNNNSILNTLFVKFLGLAKVQGGFEYIVNTSAQPALSLSGLNNMKLPIPPLQEQSAIVAHIEAQSSKIDKAIALQQQQIRSLKELKATLIDGAVTGKIKVN